jgi:hypothetical protein
VADLIPQGLQSAESDHTHEGLGINLRGILIPAGCLAAICAAVLVLLWGLLTFFDSHRERPQASLSPRAGLPQEPPAPRLQDYPPLDLAGFRAREEAELNGYQWIDRSAGRVEVPVDRAKELFLQDYARAGKSSPVRANAATRTQATGGHARE